MYQIAEFPQDRYRFRLYDNGSRLTWQQIQAQQGCVAILNLAYFSLTTYAYQSAVMIGGTWLCSPAWHAYGLCIDKDGYLTAGTEDEAVCDYAIGCPAVLVNGRRQSDEVYAKNGATYTGIKADGTVVALLAGKDDGLSSARAEEIMLSRGCVSVFRWDGSWSSQGTLGPGKEVQPSQSRICRSWLLIFEKEREDKPVDEITSAIMTSSACWKAGRTIAPRGIMVHSTAAPGVMADSLRSAWNSPGADAAAHAIVDDTHTLQTLPWTCRGWHAGVGTGGGSANDTHIGFEICEPEECRLLPEEWTPLYRGNTNPAWAVKRLQLELQARGYDPKGVDGSFGPGCQAALRACQADLGLEADGSCGPATRAALAQRQGSCLAYDPKDTEEYFQAVWSRAVTLCAKLCRDYGLDPMTDILCHAEGFRAGIASNHADVEHWFPRHGKTMDDFRKAVKEQMDGKNEAAADPEPWYAGDRKWVMEMGIADGTRPEEAATRAEVWAMLHRFAKGGS